MNCGYAPFRVRIQRTHFSSRDAITASSLQKPWSRALLQLRAQSTCIETCTAMYLNLFSSAQHPSFVIETQTCQLTQARAFPYLGLLYRPRWGDYLCNTRIQGSTIASRLHMQLTLHSTMLSFSCNAGLSETTLSILPGLFLASTPEKTAQQPK